MSGIISIVLTKDYQQKGHFSPRNAFMRLVEGLSNNQSNVLFIEGYEAPGHITPFVQIFQNPSKV